MINSMQKALIFKDLRAITNNKRMFSVLLIVPLIFTVVLPTIFILTFALSPTDTDDFKAILDMLPAEALSGDIVRTAMVFLMNNIMPVFFLLIPIMASSVMAASSFVGEKEKRTLETLLYCPLSLKRIFDAKILASFALSMLISLASFVVMLLVFSIETQLIIGSLVLPGISWLILLLLVSPSISLIAITIIVRGSAKAQTMEESQQRSMFLILPIMLLFVGQFVGIISVGPWLLLVLGIVFAVIAFFALKSSAGKFNYEALL